MTRALAWLRSAGSWLVAAGGVVGAIAEAGDWLARDLEEQAAIARDLEESRRFRAEVAARHGLDP
jgi:hypothetical protein